MNPRSAAAARILLLERRDGIAERDRSGARVRRYRLARVQKAARPAIARSRFEDLKRMYD
ncbi:MAG TPA: hypothetical protein VN751_05815 [Solirubrobacteraceae bacterium]|jgi:hypothetical protein|nr:hypothetical protein [Solirubrobacteraceae bacterium]